MKQSRIEYLGARCAAWLMVAAAPLATAQTPSTSPVSPPAATSPAATSPAATSPGAEPAAAPDADQIGYLFGLTFGEQMRTAGITDQLTVESLTRGLKDALQGKKSTPAEQQEVQRYVRSAMEAAIARNETAAKDFLARNGHEKGVVTTASGLEYRIVTAGNHKAAAIMPADLVTVQYRGKLLDGTEFDSTYARGVPASFTVNRVIPGWQEALVLMKPGAKWQLFVPPELAYGANAKPGIPGGSLLIFDVDLISVRSTGTPAAPARPGANSAPKSK